MRAIVFRHHHGAAGVLIEAMDNAGPLLAADAGQICAVMEQRIHQGVRLVARAGMDDEAGRLIDDEQVVIFKKNRGAQFPPAAPRSSRAAVPLA